MVLLTEHVAAVVDQARCTGCGACVQTCPESAITLTNRADGFLYPSVNEEACTACRRCLSVCPAHVVIEGRAPLAVYAAVNRDSDVLLRSSSGGAFTALAEIVLRDGGVVYGCAFDEQLSARHVRVEAMPELDGLRGSKYVQSDTGRTFIEVKADLEAGRRVLYSGCPCQIAGLKAFLKQSRVSRVRLLCVDLVCHGVASREMFQGYLSWLSEKYRGRVIAFEFRDKSRGWGLVGRASFRRGRRAFSRPIHPLSSYYYHHYLRGTDYRESCYQCQHANLTRQGDITLGDFWGVERFHKEIPSERGVSLLLLNSPRALAMEPELDQLLHLTPSSLERAAATNDQLLRPAISDESRAQLLSTFQREGASGIAQQYRRAHRRDIVVGYVKARIPPRIRRTLRRALGRS